MAVRVRIEGLTKRFGDVVALEDVSIEVEPGELFFLIGPSGCGKTTLLRAVAGFVRPDSGRIHFDERDITDVPPHRRNTALVFQGYALWPHMTVKENVEYGLRVRGLPPSERRARAAEILEIVRLDELADRYPSELSGGQQQRVALARAIVVQPDVLLLDEPLSNLDARLRVEMRREILRIHRQTGITAIYVTHDQKEALSMAQRIAILNEGRIAQVGRPEHCYRRPRTRFVAQFLGEANFIEGNVVAADQSAIHVETPVGRLRVALCEGEAARPSPGQSVCCCFRPESLRVATPSDRPCDNRFSARIVSVTYLGETLEYELSAADGKLLLRAVVVGGAPAREGTETDLSVAPEDIVLL